MLIRSTPNAGRFAAIRASASATLIRSVIGQAVLADRRRAVFSHDKSMVAGRGYNNLGLAQRETHPPSATAFTCAQTVEPGASFMLRDERWVIRASRKVPPASS